MSELPDGISRAEPPNPRDSAAAILLRPAGDGRWGVLLGLRARGSRFMPGHLAFPGGGMEPADRPGEPGAFRRCASRELLEETGLDVPAERWVEAGERTTPPMFPVRFRTRFFVARFDGPADPGPASDENEQLAFIDPGWIVDQWSAGASKLPPPVLPLLRVLAHAAGSDPADAALRLARANAQEERAPRIEFLPDVWMLPVATATLPPATHTNVWMPGRDRFVIVDPGSDDEQEIRRLLEVVARRRQTGAGALAVLLTHQHHDHTAGAQRVAAELALPLRAHPRVLEAGDFPGDVEPLDDGDEIDLGGLLLRAVSTPGHAPGHLSFHLPGAKALVAGDLLSGLSTILIDPDHGDMQAYLDSLERARRLECKILLPGHGPPLPGRALDRLLTHRRRREAGILERLGTGPADLADLARTIYAEVPEMPAALTERQALSHLLALERAGRVLRADSDGHSWSVARESSAQRIERILRDRFRPTQFELRDDSAQHVGHRGASSGGGHYHVTLVSESFEGLSRLQQHRRVNEALADLFGGEIHALALKTSAPSEG